MTANNLFLPIAGAAAVAPLSFGAFILLGNLERPVLSVVLMAAATLLLAGLTFKKARPFSLGVIGGYTLLTLVSGGACTIGFAGSGEGALAAFFIYPTLIGLALIAATVIVIVQSRRKQS